MASPSARGWLGPGNLEIEVIDLADVGEVMLRGRLSVIVDRIKGSLV
ncbi:MAG: hypothetical protein QXM81_05430 [Nitrososphaerota archaeon]